MQVQDVGAEGQSVFPEFAGYACWRNGGSRLQIFVHPALYRAAANAALVASAARQPSEIGGLLLGKVIPGVNIRSIVISQVVGVDSEGVLFNTTAKDLETLKAASRKGELGESLHAVGYFRSHLRSGAVVWPQDTNFFESTVDGAPAALLILRPEGKTSCVPQFYFWREGKLEAETAQPFRPESESATTAPVKSTGTATGLAAPATRVSEPAVSPRVATAPQEIAPIPVSRDRDKVERGSIRTRSHLVAAGLLIAACLGGFWARTLIQNYVRNSANSDAPTLIGLQVERGAGGQLNLNWNRNLPGLSSTQTATLSIADGPYHRNVAIDSEQLRFGRLTYFAQTSDVQFHFEIDLGDDRSLTEKLHVVIPGDQAVIDARNTEAAELPKFREERSAAQRVAQLRIPPANRMGASVQPVTSPGTAPEQKDEDTIPQKTFQAPPVARVTAKTAATPLLDGSKQPAIAWNNSLRTFQVQNPLPAEAPPAAVPKYTSSAPAPEQSAKAPALAELETPARPLRQVVPDARLFGRTFIRDAATLDVAVEIDTRGRVIEAHTLNPKAVDAFLAAQALVAAREWTFKPAQSGGKSVPSTYTIQFRFRP